MPGTEKSDRRYYRIEADSPVLEVIRRAFEKQREHSKAMDALREELGVKEIWVGGLLREFAGVTFPGKLPVGWRKGKTCAVPDKRVKAGRDLAERFNKLPPGISAMSFSGMLDEFDQPGSYSDWDCDSSIQFTTYERHGDVHVLLVPSTRTVTPPGCTLLKTSEYWQIRESADSAHLESPATGMAETSADPKEP
jgi:hypothetical protein